MSTLAMDINSENSAVSAAQSGVSGVRITLAISILLGPLVWLVCRAISGRFVGGGQGWILLAFCVIGFELVWLAYGVALLVRKGFTATQ